MVAAATIATACRDGKEATRPPADSVISCRSNYLWAQDARLLMYICVCYYMLIYATIAEGCRL